MYDAYSLYGKRLVGSCGFSLKYNQGAYPFNWPQVAEPSPAPTPSSAPSHTPSLPPTSTPTEIMPFVGNFSCLESCEFYPGIPPSGSLLGLCDFFSQDTFYLCSTFSMLHGLCKVPKCLSSCTVQDYCYFAVNTAANCPRGMYACTSIDMKLPVSFFYHLQLSCWALYSIDTLIRTIGVIHIITHTRIVAFVSLETIDILFDLYLIIYLKNFLCFLLCHAILLTISVWRGE
jgi:hypothetical protein